MYNRKLEVFLSVAEEGSFSKAGGLLYISPSAVIQKINHLEQELGVTLFVRTNQGVRLTEAGTFLAQAAREYIAAGQKIRADLEAIAARPNTICVGTSHHQKVQLLYDLWVMFSRQGGSSYIRLVNLEEGPRAMDRAEVIESVGDNSPWQSEWEFLKLCDMPLGCAITRHKVNEFGRKLAFEVLKGWVVYSCIPAGTRAREQVYEGLLAQGIEIRKTENYDMDLMWQGASKPYAMLAPLCWQDVMSDTLILPFEGPITLPYGLFYRREISRPAEEFIRFVRDLRDGRLPGLTFPAFWRLEMDESI